MPKEIIKNVVGGDTDVKIGWSREAGYLQIATVAPQGRELNSTIPEANGWHVDLDRDTINQLIRVLRKARTQIYGKDE